MARAVKKKPASPPEKLAPRKPGRPSKLTPEIREKILSLVKIGAFPEVAARASGISHATYYRWMAEGEKQEAGEYREFRDAIEQADADGELRWVMELRRELKGPAKLEMIGRRYRPRWGAKPELQVTGIVTLAPHEQLEATLLALADKAAAKAASAGAGDGAADARDGPAKSDVD